MSCSYADGLSPYDDKGVLGAPEKFDDAEKLDTKCNLLAKQISEARHVVFHTGAGISTTAGIPDFRGPNGVWTLEKKGLKPNVNISFNDAVPTKTHMALKQLVDLGMVKYIVSQNIDGLHLRSGLKREFLSELHGNMFIEQCDTCEKQFIRHSATTSVGQKLLDKNCPRVKLTGRACRGKIRDTVLDWEANLPDLDLKLSELHSSVADLNICLGTTLQIVPSGNLPLNTLKYGGRMVIVNLQATKHDKKADMIINAYVDDVMVKVMKKLGLEIPEYTPEMDPSKTEGLHDGSKLIEWTIFKDDLNSAKKLHEIHCKNFKKRKLEMKDIKKKIKKEEVEE
ncbi:PREDICTED: NAD-dependent protein deacetylase Sirt6 [Nicrophorus vespilloides]|uniref:protein acetyllysine N-acetyltransferase n=1 Tax=Nicrophorus vespilloides TaxID=110193 RepID=A0ABM1MEM5_NICVS|nr:PREDICTED: NAD-dependent protein deacetylase Sirt6 [Nicrophorus vespilloides]XP_017773025.1 PREDICTED: NAD-dependent protein deacetylase Sirt6 [Nicrophorus vespilloides]